MILKNISKSDIFINLILCHENPQIKKENINTCTLPIIKEKMKVNNVYNILIKREKEEFYVKKKKVVAVAAILSAVIISFLGGQTFSKYVTEIKGSGSAEVAAWSFKVYGDNEQTQTVRLASTVNDQTLVNNKIAPGTKGSFVIKVDGRGSDVGIKYNFKLQNETQKPSNLLFTYSGITFRNLSELLEAAGGTIDANADENAKSKTSCY